MNEKIYVAGPYTDDDNEIVERNVTKAITVADQLGQLGFKPFIPHLFHYWEEQITNHGYEFWMEQGSEWLLVCDGILRIPGESSGSDREMQMAKENGIPRFYNIGEVIFYFEDNLKNRLINYEQKRT